MMPAARRMSENESDIWSAHAIHCVAMVQKGNSGRGGVERRHAGIGAADGLPASQILRWVNEFRCRLAAVHKHVSTCRRSRAQQRGMVSP